jgi:uncharacterized membrane protein YebE (DUF533 family)
VDNSQILSIFLRGALGSRGRKRARKAVNFLSGKRGFLTASGLLGAAGVAWGLYDTLANQNAAASPVPAGGGSAPGATVPPPLPATATAVAPPPDRGLPFDVLRVVRLAVSAARADGTLLPAERALILSHAREAGVESIVEEELASPRPLSEIVAGIADETRKRELYILAFTMVRADEHVSGAERIYLAQLAHQLGLDATTVAQIEADIAAKIDAAPETEQ